MFGCRGILVGGLCAISMAFATPAPRAATLRLAPATVELTGPWRFHVGDDTRWATPDFDDRDWETVDLTPEAGAHDGDVGLPGYVAGWSQRGHPGYSGFAWYRLAVTVEAAPGTALALAGPTLVDSTYQLYVDGTLAGGPGDFSGATPRAYSVRPSVFVLPTPAAGGPRTYQLAMRVWMDVADVGSESGGMHIAPTLGTDDSIAQLHEVQWLRTFKEYVVDAIEPFAFVLLAIMALALPPGDGRRRAWLVVALLALALLRVNQVTYAWTTWQSLRGYDIATAVVWRPLALAAWILAWREWFALTRPRWLPTAVLALAAVHVALALLGRPWFLPEAASGIAATANVLVKAVRLLDVALYLWVVGAGVRRSPTLAGGMAALAALLVGIGLFAGEVSALGVPGIWFPYGTGVARGQYAYAAFIAVLFGLILWQARQAPHAPSSRAPT
jgi:hypothetical protein